MCLEHSVGRLLSGSPRPLADAAIVGLVHASQEVWPDGVSVHLFNCVPYCDQIAARRLGGKASGVLVHFRLVKSLQKLTLLC
jgi:hypothetical protein